MFADMANADRVHADMVNADMVHDDRVNADKSVSVKCERADQPEDLSAKCKSVYVQTDKCGGNIFENLFDGFSEKQVQTLLDILARIVARRESDCFLEKEPVYDEPVCTIKVRPKTDKLVLTYVKPIRV